MIALVITGCCSGYDCGLVANVQTRQEYDQFLGDHPNYNPRRNLPYTFDPEDGGWEIRK